MYWLRPCYHDGTMGKYSLNLTKDAVVECYFDSLDFSYLRISMITFEKICDVARLYYLHNFNLNTQIF